jgi:Ca-activated chloride channel family protein
MRTFLFLAAAALFAQEPLSIKVDVSLVNFAFIVRDQSGALAGTLTKDDIEVIEDGVPQQVRFFGRSADLPLRLALVMDVSGSQEKFVKRHNHDLEKFVSAAITPKDSALLICFGNQIRVVSDFGAAPHDMMENLSEFDKRRPSFLVLDRDTTRFAGTALFDAVYAAASEKLGTPKSERRAIILFSDGEDNSSAHDLMDAIEAAQDADSLIYTVRYTDIRKGVLTSRDRYGIREMNRLALETGGIAFDAEKDKVPESLRKVAEELRSMYDVGFVSTDATRDGRFRKVEIRVKRPGLTVRAKPGYYAH